MYRKIHFVGNGYKVKIMKIKLSGILCIVFGTIKIEMDEFIIEGLGVYKSVLKSDISLDDIKNHSVMTTILENYE